MVMGIELNTLRIICYINLHYSAIKCLNSIVIDFEFCCERIRHTSFPQAGVFIILKYSTSIYGDLI
jgi:hypothetical protein